MENIKSWKFWMGVVTFFVCLGWFMLADNTSGYNSLFKILVIIGSLIMAIWSLEKPKWIYGRGMVPPPLFVKGCGYLSGIAWAFVIVLSLLYSIALF